MIFDDNYENENLQLQQQQQNKNRDLNKNTNSTNNKKEILQKRHYFILEQLQLITNQAPM